ncbi:uncharacterized protein TrAtP1_013211 [Trichoderma atroviride]|uniref:uncharacterized protein n=1 Tax=Hypocrea atroviridis TaxID=63577 RepID=UPI003319382E|nr:hypothetical protein TrAtP1_013211 [Trichoderma atroviride]
MTALRAWVRRGLTTPILSEPLIPGFELDWFADTFKDLKNAEWYKCSDHNTTDEVVRYEARTNASTTNSEDPRLEARDFDIVDARDVCAIRQRLAKLVGWRSPVSQEAIAITKAIEATMSILAQNDDSLHADSYRNLRYSWEYPIELGRQQVKMPRLNINRHGHKWNANAGEIEAALSLRLFYVKSFERKGLSAAGVIHTRSDVSDDEWLRIKGKASEFLGQPEFTNDPTALLGGGRSCL